MLKYFWINHNGKSDWRIGAILPRDSVRLASPLGYRFRVVNRSGRTIALEIKKTTGVVNIEDTPDSLVLRWEWDALADIDFESSKTQATKPEYQAFIRRHNIWRRKDGVEKQVSHSGFEDDSFTASYPTPDGRHAVATKSRAGVIDAATGKEAVFLHKAELGPLESTYIFPERFVAKGRDNETDSYGIIIKPPNFDKDMTYPVLDIIYAHPSQFIVPKNFKNFGALRAMSEAGYVIVMVDGMGTNWRSKAFHDVAYKNAKDAGIPDHIAWIKAAAETRPWMNLERVGIQGSSSGGHSAASAVLHHGDFYKAAVARAACHDPRLGTARWEEMYMGWPVDASYAENANGTHARKLTGALMLCTGEMDDVVDPASTMQFADALIKADRDFDLVIVPGDTHYASSDWLAKKEARFFKRYLQDGEPSPNAAVPNEPGPEVSDIC